MGFRVGQAAGTKLLSWPQCNKYLSLVHKQGESLCDLCIEWTRRTAWAEPEEKPEGRENSSEQEIRLP